jgi:hypothetical protein
MQNYNHRIGPDITNRIIWERFMRVLARSVLIVGIAGVLGSVGTNAQNMMVPGAHTIALKSGESEEVDDIYYVTNCVSLLNSPPQAEVVDGPPGVTASVKEDMVLPRLQKCPTKIKGGKLVVSAGKVEDPSNSQLTVRVTFDTREGIRKQTWVINLALIP